MIQESGEVESVGVELEWADVDRHAEIPRHLGEWNTADYSIVNSDGHANCPTGETWRWGGEINTLPTATSVGQGRIVEELAIMLQPTINYKCNLHVHVKPVKNLLEDLDLLKNVAMSMRAAEPFVYSVVEPIVKPDAGDYDTMDAYRGAVKRWRRNLTSHQYSLPEARWIEMMRARTVQEFKDAHAPPTMTGGRAWHVTPRAGMNLRSLWKHGTIEFRHFPGTATPIEVSHAASWCIQFVDAMITGQRTAQEIWEDREHWYLPKFKPYDHKLQLGFELTRWKK